MKEDQHQLLSLLATIVNRGAILPIGTIQPTALPNRRSSRSASTVSPVQRDVIDADRIEAALELVAILMDENAAYLPIFQRLEAELESARISSSALARARALSQKARGR